MENRDRTYCSYACQYSLQNRRRWSSEGLERVQFKVANDGFVKLALDLPIEDIGHDARKLRVVMEQQFKCNGCDLDEWRGQPIMLELEHKDGVRANNKRDNLEALCPNCHSQTLTWRGRNNRKKVSDDEMRVAIETTSSLRKALVSLGMADKGGNYERAKKIKAALEDSVGLEPTVLVV